MEYISLDSIQVNHNRIEYKFSMSEEVKQFFLDTPYFMEYQIDNEPLDISCVPQGILAVPFVCNILPICWITDTVLRVSELDKAFFESIPEFKAGYENMYPNVQFKGRLEVQKITENAPEKSGRSAAFFSGGVDSWCTLLRHMEEKPDLITIWGSDVRWDNPEGWEVLHSGLKKSAEQFELPLITVRSTFRRAIYEDCLTWTYEKQLKDNWWHGVQHGIAIIAHAAPCNYVRGCSTLYIAASLCEEDKDAKIASYPTIDNHVRFADCEVYHDAFINRQEKINEIKAYCENNQTKIDMHVCWESTTGKNCCSCEKCYRTIAGLVAAGCSPEDYGFEKRRINYQTMKMLFLKKYVYQPEAERRWRPIQKQMKQNRIYLASNADFRQMKWLRNTKLKGNVFASQKIQNKEDITFGKMENSKTDKTINIGRKKRQIVKRARKGHLIENENVAKRNLEFESIQSKGSVSKNERIMNWAFYAGICLFFILFFTQIHPILVWDMDDWYYISSTRVPWPLKGEWNPARIFPEVMMPFSGLIASKLIYPITGDYLGALTIVFAIIVSLFILMYIYMFMKLVNMLFDLKKFQEYVIAVIFLLFHFIVFRVANSENYYLFYCDDATCYYFYLLPILINITLVLYFEQKKINNERTMHSCIRPFVIAMCYFGIFSNLYASYVLVIYASVRLLELLTDKVCFLDCSWSENLKKIAGWLGIIFLWFYSAYFEISGGRAESLQNADFTENIAESIRYFINRNFNINNVFIAIAIGSTIAVLMIMFFNIRKSIKIEVNIKYFIRRYILCMLVSVAYIILLSAAVLPRYSERPEIVFGIWFYLFAIIIFFICYVIKSYKIVTDVCVFIMLIMLFSINTRDRVFKESLVLNVEPSICKMIGNDLINQVIKAQENGQETVEIHVPIFEHSDNWPLALYGKNIITHSLYKHGIINQYMESTIVIDETMNEKYNLTK